MNAATAPVMNVYSGQVFYDVTRYASALPRTARPVPQGITVRSAYARPSSPTTTRGIVGSWCGSGWTLTIRDTGEGCAIRATDGGRRRHNLEDGTPAERRGGDLVRRLRRANGPPWN